MSQLTLDESTKAFEFKGSLFTLTLIVLRSSDPAAIVAQMETMASRMPRFFAHTPIVMDLGRLPKSKSDKPLNFAGITQGLREFGIIPVAVRGGSEAQHEAAVANGLALLPSTRNDLREMASQEPQQTTPPVPTPPAEHRTKLITQPVRSGQQIYARGGDLVIIAPVSPGAECLADGNIHIYGPLRGRALAGVQGNTNARIFCQTLEPELIAIAGNYLVNEDMQVPKTAHMIQVYLDGDKLKIDTL